MRFAPAAAALSLLIAVQASVGGAQERVPDPRAAILIERGEAARMAGEPQAAIDAFESALALDPGYAPIFLSLAEIARDEGLQGQAIRYYREAQLIAPGNLAAIAGEGEALAERGALAKAEAQLARLTSLCGGGCTQTQSLAAAIERGAQRQMVRADADVPENSVNQTPPAQNN